MSCSCGCGGRKRREKKRNKFVKTSKMISTRIGNSMLSVPSFICKGRKRRHGTGIDSVNLFHDSHFRITQFSITGNAEPCTPLITVGKSFTDARNCLLANDFVIQDATEIRMRFVRFAPIRVGNEIENLMMRIGTDLTIPFPEVTGNL